MISLDGKPYMVLEFKSLNYGKEVDRYAGEVEKLLGKAEYLNTRYAVLTSFRHTVVYDRTSEPQLIEFTEPNQYLSRFEELWQYLSRARARRCKDPNKNRENAERPKAVSDNKPCA